MSRLGIKRKCPNVTIESCKGRALTGGQPKETALRRHRALAIVETTAQNGGVPSLQDQRRSVVHRSSLSVGDGGGARSPSVAVTTPHRWLDVSRAAAGTVERRSAAAWDEYEWLLVETVRTIRAGRVEQSLWTAWPDLAGRGSEAERVRCISMASTQAAPRRA